MASITMTSSFLGSSTVAAATKQPLTTSRRGVFVVKASKGAEKAVVNSKEEGSSGRRDLVFAAAAAAACSIAKVAMADEPPRGSLAAKKKYAPVCVTMPTARICRKFVGTQGIASVQLQVGRSKYEGGDVHDMATVVR
ncbi:hypothetical protein RJ640_027711 [Escallonia rubra]|uniref:Photosystem II 5 kDa protein, chloroplastic n=1 Tax=Escallonia rubra TaxID=112253 RepID=A0AA88UAD5_9ASTE|nr:hypothetical protein RJ640_027711 [Escallonia rubra]